MAAGLCLLLALGGQAAAWALWSDTAEVSAELGAATVAAPTGVACQSFSGGLLGSPYARVSWTAVPGAAEYIVSLSEQPGTGLQETARTSALSVDLGVGLLEILLGGLLTLLLGNRPLAVSVQAVHPSGWTSPVVDTGVWVERTGLLPGILGGIRCRP